MNREIRTSKEVDLFIEDLPNDMQNIAASLRQIILESSSVLKEEFKWSMPNYSHKGLVCYLQTAKKHVNLGFHRGNELMESDTHKLLKGTGKTMRHIRITKMEDIKSEAFISLIQAAVALNGE